MVVCVSAAEAASTGRCGGAQQSGEPDDAEDDQPRRGQGHGEQVVRKSGVLRRQPDPMKQAESGCACAD